MPGPNDDTPDRSATGRLKSLMGDLKLPREIANHILSQIDETKHAALAVIAKEMRIFLEKTNLSDELARLLTQLSFEIKTEVRFVPNEKGGKLGLVPKVKFSSPKMKKDGQDEEKARLDAQDKKDEMNEGDARDDGEDPPT